MRSTRINRTETAKIKRLSMTVRNEHGPLSGLLAELGPVAAGLLAEPVVSSDGSYIDWHVPGVVAAVALTAAPPDMAEAAEAELAELRPRIEALAERVARYGTAMDKELARGLVDCLTVPAPNHVYIVDKHPVLTAWGHVPEKGQGHRSGLSIKATGPTTTALAPAVPPPLPRPAPRPEVSPLPPSAVVPETVAPPVVEAPTQTRQGRPKGLLLALLWAIFAVLIAAIFYLLLRACAISTLLGWTNACPANDAIVGAADIAALSAQAEDLERQVRRSTDCHPGDLLGARPAPAPADTARSDDQAVTDADTRTVDEHRGDLEITLIWSGPADLDLTAQFRCGNTDALINFHVKGQDVCGGMLDRDDNYDRHVDNPAEHIVWTDGSRIPPGPKTVAVTYFSRNGDASPDVPFEVVIRRGERSPEVFHGIAQESRHSVPEEVTVFQD